MRTDESGRATVYLLYFGYIAIMGLIGAVAALKLKSMIAKKQAV